MQSKAILFYQLYQTNVLFSTDSYFRSSSTQKLLFLLLSWEYLTKKVISFLSREFFPDPTLGFSKCQKAWPSLKMLLIVGLSYVLLTGPPLTCPTSWATPSIAQKVQVLGEEGLTQV